MKTFDIVKTPAGQIAMITEVSPTGGAHIEFFGNMECEKVAWWGEDDLIILGNVIPVIAASMCHPSGNSAHTTFEKWNNIDI